MARTCPRFATGSGPGEPRPGARRPLAFAGSMLCQPTDGRGAQPQFGRIRADRCAGLSRDAIQPRLSLHSFGEVRCMTGTDHGRWRLCPPRDGKPAKARSGSTRCAQDHGTDERWIVSGHAAATRRWLSRWRPRAGRRWCSAKVLNKARCAWGPCRRCASCLVRPGSGGGRRPRSQAATVGRKWRSLSRCG